MAAQQDGRRRLSVLPSAEFVQMPPAKYTFRYISERRDHGTITVKIRVNDYVGRVKAVLACVTENDYDGDPMPHPNKLKCPSDKRNCKDGVCTVQKNITPQKNVIVFNQIGIQRIKKEVVEEAMRIRTSNTDFPFVTEYNKRVDSEDSIDVHIINRTRVRLACRVLIQDAIGALTNPLKAVVTTLVTHYPEKLKIMHASHDCGPATGGLRVFLFTAKLPNSVVVLFRERDSEWRAQGETVEQHMRVALQFTAPPYHNLYHYEPVQVYYFMAVTMDSEDEQNEENRRAFTYLPITDEAVYREKLDKSFNEMTTNILKGVKGGSEAALHQHAAGPIESMDITIPISSSDLHGGDIPESQHDDHPIPPGIFDFVFESEDMNEVDTTARHNLVQPLWIPRWLLEQPMEEDGAGSEDLPG